MNGPSLSGPSHGDLPASVDGPDAGTDRRDRFCIVGAGSSGLAAAKAFADAGIPFDCLEREADIGGNWNYASPAGGIYASTHTISSKRLTEYLDFPMPREYPPFPHHRQILEYLRAYAKHFGLYERIDFDRSIERIERTADHAMPASLAKSASPKRQRREFSSWTVKLTDGSTRNYRGVIIANGHNWDPRLPTYPGTFAGETLHSRHYKTPEVFAGKRVLVVGAGNSGCDIAVEAAQHAERTYLSMRRGYHFMPKFWQGAPMDRLNEKLMEKRIPLFVRRWLGGRVERASFGKPGRYGLPVPDHRLFESHPIINQQLFYWLAHGRIIPKPDVAELCDSEVRFSDGTRESIDLILYATGYKISFPFLDNRLLNWQDDRPQLFLNVFHPAEDDLFVIGLIQPDSGQFGLVDLQSRLAARFVAACDAGRPEAAKFRDLKAAQYGDDLRNGVRCLDSPRHLLEVEHFSYRKRLERLLAGFEA
jgi:cation diffusion facilitator CzcD-associated flavoprotein CzcO